MNSTIKTAVKTVEELSQSNKNSNTEREDIYHTKGGLGESLKENGNSEYVIHGQYMRRINIQLVSEEDSFLWLSRGDMKAETEK
jgi:hypothetical protein